MCRHGIRAGHVQNLQVPAQELVPVVVATHEPASALHIRSLRKGLLRVNEHKESAEKNQKDCKNLDVGGVSERFQHTVKGFRKERQDFAQA